MKNHKLLQAPTIIKWTLLTWAGWAIGIALIILLGIASETVGLSLGGNAIVGIGMGTGVGFMQWVALKKYVTASQKWIWFSMIGFSVSYIALDICCFYFGLKPETLLPVATALGALITGWLQYKYLLDKIFTNARSWVLSYFSAWVLAHFLTTGLMTIPNFKLEDYLPRYIAIPLVFILILIGGPLLGYLTGRKIIAILKSKVKINETLN